jgi:hypothetical protein
MEENKLELENDNNDFTVSEYCQKYVVPTSIFEISPDVHQNLYYISNDDMVQIKHFIVYCVKQRLRVRKTAKDKKKTETKKPTKQIPLIYKIDDVFVSPEKKKIITISDHPDG